MTPQAARRAWASWRDSWRHAVAHDMRVIRPGTYAHGKPVAGLMRAMMYACALDYAEARGWREPGTGEAQP